MTTNLEQLLAALPATDAAEDVELSPRTRPIPTGRLARLWTVGAMQAQIAAAYASMWVRTFFDGARQRELVETHLASALRLFEGMTYLRGAVMKVGQALATYPNLVPHEVADTLARLHFDAPPMHFALIREQLENELDRDLDEVFADFDERAFSAASLGQVHRARLRNGERVAVKIQYPGIAETIRSDMRNLTAILSPLRLTRDWDNISAHLAEVREVLDAEVDYESEAENTERARALFKPEDGVVVPRVHREASTARVLTMDYVDGIHLDDWLATNPSQSERDAFGEKMYTVAFRFYYAGRSAYADPHPGNYLFMSDGRLGLIDFGCVPRYSDEEWALLGEMDMMIHRGRNELREALVRFCDLTSAEANDEERMALIEESYRWNIETLFHQPFDFSDPRHLQIGMSVFARAIAKRYTRSHPVQLYLSRTILGLRSMLYTMKARVDVRAIRAREIRATGWDWLDQVEL
jgi:predicted unusual protein kinase regulating ubiquinone biosynthesis (AarF/ABC1/UbiB family)